MYVINHLLERVDENFAEQFFFLEGSFAFYFHFYNSFSRVFINFFSLQELGSIFFLTF